MTITSSRSTVPGTMSGPEPCLKWIWMGGEKSAQCQRREGPCPYPDKLLDLLTSKGRHCAADVHKYIEDLPTLEEEWLRG